MNPFFCLGILDVGEVCAEGPSNVGVVIAFEGSGFGARRGLFSFLERIGFTDFVDSFDYS